MTGLLDFNPGLVINTETVGGNISVVFCKAIMCPLVPMKQLLHVPADLTQVERHVEQRTPVVSVLAQPDGRTARDLKLEDRSFITHRFDTKSLLTALCYAQLPLIELCLSV